MKHEKMTQTYPLETSVRIFKKGIQDFLTKKKKKMITQRNIFQFRKYFSPQTHEYLNYIEIIVFKI